MYSRWINLFVFLILHTSLILCQITKEGYVGVNFNAGGGFGGHLSGSGSGNLVKTYEGSAHTAGTNVEGSITKTIEVPAPAIQSSLYFEKHVSPVIVEKEVIKSVPVVVPEKVVTEEVVHVPQNVYVRKVHTRRPVQRRKYVYVDTHSEVAPPRIGFLGKLLAVGAAPAPLPAPVPASDVHIEKHVEKEVIVPQTSVQNTATYSATATVNKNGQLFNDIFNIPISTLRAVNQLVNNIAGGVTVTKQVNTQAVKSSSAEVHANTNAHTNANAYVHANAHIHT